MQDKWRTIKELPGYKIYISGKVVNKKTKRQTKAFPDKDGYLRVVLLYKGRLYNRIVHRLIAIAFIPNTKNLPQINHIDGDKRNNDINNLEWCSPSENSRHAFKLGLQKGRPGEKHHNCKLTEEDVKQIHKLVKLKVTRKVIGEYFGIHKNHIYRIINGLRWKHLMQRG